MRTTAVAGSAEFGSGTATFGSGATYDVTGATVVSGGTANFNAGSTVQAVGSAVTVSGGALNLNAGASYPTAFSLLNMIEENAYAQGHREMASAGRLRQRAGSWENTFSLLTAAGCTTAEIASALREAGYTFAAQDLDGYRSGAMNEALTEAARESGSRSE